ncbi:hypothetical protein AND_001084 [Anopheles darlingi]|uniref:Guanine nucleotide exchange factor n=1 Tax=Anopheles darlingi TaxID=43151 RepID=W5JW08_ANODA|nr:hypothetical protein AND_001084 [Anopheles darlingi]
MDGTGGGLNRPAGKKSVDSRHADDDWHDVAPIVVVMVLVSSCYYADIIAGESPTAAASSSDRASERQQQQQQPDADKPVPTRKAPVSSQQQQRPQTLTPTREAASNGSMAMQTLVLTVNKDATGYGMKVSGDKPVFVESVKPGGAARRAGLMPDDMILKVNGTSVRALTHTNVVDLIKASDVVELTVQRGTNRMQRPSPSSNSIAPLTPVAQRNSITAPQPVDFAKQREMEVHKINTLRLMLDQEKKNLENLNASNRQRTPESARAEATIQKLQKELHQMCGESGPYPLFNASATSPSLFPQPQAPHSGSITPAFLSRFPRSLSSLSLGTKKKSSDAKEISSPNASAYLGSPECMSPDGGSVGGPFGGGTGVSPGTPTKSSKKHSTSSAADHHHLQHHHQQHHHLHAGNAAGGSHHHLRGKQGGPPSDIPPPLPQRNNIPKKQEDTVDTMMVGSRRNILVSDLDHLVLTTPESGTSGGDTNNLNSSAPAATKGSGSKSSRGGKKKSSSNSTVNSNSSNTSNSSSSSNNNKNNNNSLPSEPLMPCDPPIMMATSTTMYLADQQQQRFSGGTAELQAEPPPLPPRQPGMLEGMVQGQTLILNSDHGAVPQFANSLNNNAPANSITTGSNNASSTTTNNNNNNSTSGSGSSSPATQAQTGGTTGSTNNGNAPVTSSRGGGGGPIDMRPPPNSINTLMNYPLITTCTPVRDNMAAAFPLSYRPNIVHQMQQHQQTTALNQSVAAAAAAAAAAGVNQSISKKHRRIVSSPENIGSKDFGSAADHSSTPYSHHKMPSDSWDKRSEVTPPGTPPPPYPSTTWMSGGSGGSGGGHHHSPHQHQHSHPHHHGGNHLHHHEHTATAGDLAIANPHSHNNNHHHHQQHHQHNNGSSNNNNNHSNHMSSYHPHHTHHHPASHQSPVGGAPALPLPNAVQGNIVAAQPNIAQKPIISMEDDDISDQESFIEENSPFRSLTQLLEAEKSVYLAVFLNFVLTNSDPSALLFYLITTLYKEGSIKDMRKWAYEIHSTFLVPGAPLLCANVDEALAREIDDVLQKENDKVEILRKVFWRSRLKAKESITQQLQQFQTKRTAGLGTMYGPNDQLLQMAKGDKVKEQRIVEETLLPKLQQYLDDLERESPKEDAKKSALCSALSTVLQRFFVTRSNPGSPIDKVHHFVSREKSFKSRLMAKNRKQTVLGHYLHLQPYYEVTRCNHCQNILWGVSPQGYHCTNCELNIHRACAKDLKECCPGPANQKNDSKITKLMEKISSRNHHQDKSRRHDDDAAAEEAAIGGVDAVKIVIKRPSIVCNLAIVLKSPKRSFGIPHRPVVQEFKTSPRSRPDLLNTPPTATRLLMWFRTGSFPDDRFSVSTLKKRMRRKHKGDDSQKQKDESVASSSSSAATVPDGSGKSTTIDGVNGSAAGSSSDGNGKGSSFKEPTAETSTSPPVTHGLMIIRAPPRSYKKSSSKSRLDGAKKAVTMPITDTKTTTGSATIKCSRSNTNLNINTLIKNKLNHHKHSTPAKLLAKIAGDHHQQPQDGAAGGGGALEQQQQQAGPYPLASSKSLQKSKSRKNLQQQQQQQQQQQKRSGNSSLPSSTAATTTVETFTKTGEEEVTDGAAADGGTKGDRGSKRGANISLARQPSDRRQDASGHLGNTSGASDHLNTSESYGYKQTGADDDQFRENVKSKSAPVSVNRSESYKERSQKKTRTTRRKTSDPSLTKTASSRRPVFGLSGSDSGSGSGSIFVYRRIEGRYMADNEESTSPPRANMFQNDEQNESSSLANNNYSSSSTSSLPLALDSRSTSLEAVGGSGGGGGGSGSGGPGVTSAASSSAGPAGGLTSGTQIPHSPGASLLSSSGASASLAGVGAGTVGGLGVSGANLPTAREWIDSEDEGTVEPEADWSSNIPPEILSSIGDLEKKRQEVINEIYQTERNHVRTLRLLEGIFMRPLQESGALPSELLNLLFPHSLIHLKDLHSAFEFKLKQRRSEHVNVVREIGDLLLSMFDGQSGEELREHAAHFCARQQIALEALKERRKKDEQLQRLLIKAESHKACRRLQLKDLLPTALQRLTKYPLLFDNLYNFTVRSSPNNETEAHAIRKSLISAKRILDHVNQAVRTEEDMHKLLTIQRKLDKSGLDKDASSEFRNIDLTVRKLVHDGPLTMKKNPGVQLHGLLFEDIMVLLQKQDDKYLLKYHSSPGLGGSESKYAEGRFNPITKINLILVRQSAVDKNTFFLINTNVSQMLELTAPSSTECKT